jgi:hypothetical protein
MIVDRGRVRPRLACKCVGIVAEAARHASAELRQNCGVTARYRYTTPVIDQLWRHGLHPSPTTAPQTLRDAVRDLYLFEIRALRSRLLAKEIRRPDYAGHVVELRRRYPLLSLPVEHWLEPEPGSGPPNGEGR